MMKYTNVDRLSFANAANTAINCWVTFDDLPHSVPFTASPDDSEAHGREIFARASDGDFGAVAAYIPHENIPDQNGNNAPILAQLAEIDAKTVRPQRAVLHAVANAMTPDPADLQYLAKLKLEADGLREQMVAQ